MHLITLDGDILNLVNYENLRMMISFYWKFWRWIWPILWHGDFWRKLMVGFGCDTIPILQYNHNTCIWVGLNWKLMYFSMGSLLDKCHRGYAEAASVKKTMKWKKKQWHEVTELLEIPMQFPGWPKAMAGRQIGRASCRERV